MHVTDPLAGGVPVYAVVCGSVWQAARLDASVKATSLAALQAQYDKLQVKLQKTEREEKTVVKTLTETSTEISTLKVRTPTIHKYLVLWSVCVCVCVCAFVTVHHPTH